MDVSSFFEYPNLALSESAGDLVFLADLSEEDWRKLLARTDVRRFRAGEEVIRAGDTDAEHRYRRLLIGTDGSIAGAILLGYPNDTAAVNEAVKRGDDVSDRLDALQAGDWSVLTTRSAATA